MIDIIDRIRERTHDLRLDIECLLDDCITEIESLRQEVIDYRSLSELSQCKIEELENRINTLGYGIILINKEKESLRAKVAELESLKASQGESVGIAGSMPGTSGFTMAAFKSDLVPIGTPLYTSAPTIPKGWKLTVSEDDERMWLHVSGPVTGLAALSCDNRTIAAKVLREFAKDLPAAPEYKGEE